MQQTLAPSKKERNSTLELLRILTMFLIITSHFTAHGGISANFFSSNFNVYLIQCLIIGNLGVVIFVMISGYFYDNSKFSFKKLAKLVLQVCFYHLVIYTIFVLLNKETLSISKLEQNIFPVMTNQYWFATTYIMLYFIMPYLNSFIKRQVVN